MDDKQKKILKASLKVKPRAEELLRETVKAKPRKMRLTETKQARLAKKTYRLKRKHYQRLVAKNGGRLNRLTKRNVVKLNVAAAQKKMLEAKRDSEAHQLLLKKMRQADNSYLPTQLKYNVKQAAIENVKTSPLKVLEGDETLSDGVQKTEKVLRHYRQGKQSIELSKTGGRVAVNMTKRSYGLVNRSFNLARGQGFTRTPDELTLKKQLKRRYQKWTYKRKQLKAAKEAKQSSSVVMNLLRGKTSPKAAATALAHNPVVWMMSGLLLLMLMIVAAAADVPNPSIKQTDFELTEAWVDMTKLDADHSTDGNQFFTNFDGVMFYMNEQFDDYDVNGTLQTADDETLSPDTPATAPLAKDYLSDLWTALNGKAPGYDLTTMDDLEKKKGSPYELSKDDYDTMTEMQEAMGYASLDGQLTFPYATDNLIVNRRFGYEGKNLHSSIDTTTAENQPILAPLSGKITVNSANELTIENADQEEKVSLKKLDTSRLKTGDNISSGAFLGNSQSNYLDIKLEKYDADDKKWKVVNPAFYFPKVTYTQMTTLAANDYNPDSKQLASAQAIYNYAMAHRGTLNGICAVLGNFQVEGGIDPTAVETIYDEPFTLGPRKKAAQDAGFLIADIDAAYAAKYPAITQAGIGWGQWTNERDVALVNFAKAEKKNWYDPALQIQFATAGDSPAAITALNNTLDGKVAKDIPTLTNYFLVNWEGNSGDKISERVGAAQNWYAYFTRASAGVSGKAEVEIPSQYVGKLTEPAPNEQDVTGYPGNNYALNNCTWYVYNREYQIGNHIPSNLGNGGQWGQTAKAAGYATSSTPKVGDMASFSPGTAGSSTLYGHVAFVEYVNSDGSYLVSEMNVVDPGSGKISYRTISGTDGVTFIDPKK